MQNRLEEVAKELKKAVSLLAQMTDLLQMLLQVLTDK